MENEIRNSENFINKKTGKKTGFETPIDYFNNLDEAINVKLSENRFEKNNGFKVPDSYFTNLEDNILSKVLEKETKVISLKDRIIKILPLATAASIVLFIGLNSFVFNKAEENLFDKLEDIEVENWISNNINLINDNDFALTYNDIEFDALEIIPNSISNDDLENYLNNEENLSLILEND